MKFAKAPSSDEASLRLLDAAEALVRRLMPGPETAAAATPPATPTATQISGGGSHA